VRIRWLVAWCLILAFVLLACTDSGDRDHLVGSDAPTGAPLETTVSDRATPIQPAPSATPEEELEIYGGHVYESRQYLHIIGEVVNPIDECIEYVRIVAMYYDAAGVMVGTDFTYAELDKILPGDRSPFDLSSDKTTFGGEMVGYELQVQARTTSSAPYNGLAVEATNQYLSGDYWHLEGLVTNTGDRDCEYVKIVAGFYDTDDRIVGTNFTYAEMDIVAAGGHSPFDLSAGNLPEWDHYRLWVQASPIN
jgi:hypothetical protein